MPEIERTSRNSARVRVSRPFPAARLREEIKSAVERLPNWRVETSESGRLHAVRTTRLLRFKDDITATIEPEGEGSKATIDSASRLGKSDRGQNPRNLQELLGALGDEPEDS